MPKPTPMTWKEAVLLVLGEHGEPVHYSDLTEEILRRRLVDSKTATPANTLYTACLTEMARNNPKIARLPGGLFTLTTPSTTVPPPATTEASWVQSLGILWRRDWIQWKSSPKLLGIQPGATTNIDFCEQRGVYVLYDGARPIYAGRSTDRPLGRRLYEHTLDRLSARWDRFSWFGLKAVTEEGALKDIPTAACTSEVFIADLEAILIEVLETPLNRRRGDDLATKEYQQLEDTSYQDQKLRAAFDALLSQRR